MKEELKGFTDGLDFKSERNRKVKDEAKGLGLPRGRLQLYRMVGGWREDFQGISVENVKWEKSSDIQVGSCLEHVVEGDDQT